MSSAHSLSNASNPSGPSSYSSPSHESSLPSTNDTFLALWPGGSRYIPQGSSLVPLLQDYVPLITKNDYVLVAQPTSTDSMPFSIPSASLRTCLYVPMNYFLVPILITEYSKFSVLPLNIHPMQTRS